MREIRFRGKRLDNGEWVYGWYVKDWDGGSHIVTEFGPDITHCWDCGANGQKSFKVDPETVEQIESGAFDAEPNGEVQRLRAALEMAQSELRWGDPTNAIERVERIIDEALSITTEPLNTEKVERVREGDVNE